MAAAVVAAYVTATSAGWATAVPLPEQDSFYTVPPGIADLPNGTILASRPIDARSYFQPLAADAWQVQYKTVDNRNEPSAYIATILVPQQEWPGAGPRPLLSYQVAEDGVGTKCAPSYALRGGLGGGPSNSFSETGMIGIALQQGWAVVVPDYQGPNSDFSGADGYAHGVLDGIRAAKTFPPAAVDPAAPVGLWGYSGGAQATAVAAQAQRAQLEAWPGSLTDNAELSRVIRSTSPLFRAGAPIAPVLIYHALNDEFAPVDSARSLAEKYCAAGTPVQRVENPLGEHGTEAAAGLPAALTYLSDRFSGRPAPSTC
ncbi:lipase [Nocardia brasiliensis]|nr:lipase [Nocardia brasiliensis]